MTGVSVLVASKGRVIRTGTALVIGAMEKFKLVGEQDKDVLNEALALQPDLIIYETQLVEHNEYQVLRKLKEICPWSKIVIFILRPLEKESFPQILDVCNGCLQGPIMPGYFIKAIELACYSGVFLFLGTVEGVKIPGSNETPYVLPGNTPGSH